MDGQFINKKNYNSLDLLKVVLAIIIVLRHCGQSFFDVGSGFNVILTNTLSPLCVPTFFAISGFLFFRKEQKISDWKHYVLRVAKLYLVWTIIYLPLIIRSMIKCGSFNIVRLIQKSLFDGSYYHLWFLPSLIVAISLVYFLSRKMSDKALACVCVALYIVGTLVNSYAFLSASLVWNGYKTIFITTKNGLFFGTLFIFIGKKIAQGFEINKWIGMAIGIVVLVVEGWYLSIIHQVSIVNMSFAAMFLVPVIVSEALNVSHRFVRVNGKFWRAVSTILFCVHPYAIFVFEAIGRKIGIPGAITTMCVVLGSFIGAMIIVKVSEKIPFLKHLA